MVENVTVRRVWCAQVAVSKTHLNFKRVFLETTFSATVGIKTHTVFNIFYASFF